VASEPSHVTWGTPWAALSTRRGKSSHLPPQPYCGEGETPRVTARDEGNTGKFFPSPWGSHRGGGTQVHRVRDRKLNRPTSPFGRDPGRVSGPLFPSRGLSSICQADADRLGDRPRKSVVTLTQKWRRRKDCVPNGYFYNNFRHSAQLSPFNFNTFYGIKTSQRSITLSEFF